MSDTCTKCGIKGKPPEHTLCDCCATNRWVQIQDVQAEEHAACLELAEFNPHDGWCGDSMSAEESQAYDDIIERIIAATNKVTEATK